MKKLLLNIFIIYSIFGILLANGHNCSPQSQDNQITFGPKEKPIIITKEEKLIIQKQKKLAKELDLAVEKGDLNKIKKLVEEKEADINWGVGYGFTPLMAAAHNDNIKIASYLIKKGANVNALTSGFPSQPVISGAISLRMIKLLVENGANINYKLRPLLFGWIHSKPSNKAKKIVTYLLEKGADINITYVGLSVLDHAHSEWKEFLIQQGAKSAKELLKKKE